MRFGMGLLDQELARRSIKRIASLRAAPTIKVSWGELVDRYTIVQLKLDNDKARLHQVSLRSELNELAREMERFSHCEPRARSFCKKMKVLNSRLWRLENKVRAMIRNGNTGDAYTQAAMAITCTNDRRSALKAAINKVAGTGFEEVKIYDSAGR